MSIVHRIYKEQGIAFTVWDGVVTADEFLVHVQRLLSDADWPLHKHLSDLQTTIMDVSIDEAVLEKASDLFGKHPKISNLKVAIVADKAFKEAVVFERLILRYIPSVIVFNNLETACTWLGIEVDTAAQALRSLRSLSRGGTDQ